MNKYIKLEDLMRFPIRLNHCDKEHGDINFVFGVETVLEFAENLPTINLESMIEPEDIVKLRELYQEGRLIALPCKVGTKVYRIVPDLPLQPRWNTLECSDPPEYKIVVRAFKLSDIDDFDKTVFLSREEAEVALRKYY